MTSALRNQFQVLLEQLAQGQCDLRQIIMGFQ